MLKDVSKAEVVMSGIERCELRRVASLGSNNFFALIYYCTLIAIATIVMFDRMGSLVSIHLGQRHVDKGFQ